MDNLPSLGVGVVYVPGLEPLLEPVDTLVDVVEVEPQTLWHYNPDKKPTPYTIPEHTLGQLNRFPQSKIIHSVGSAVGGTSKPCPHFVSAISDFIEAVNAPWCSEHLSFTNVQTRHNAFHTGFMLPLLQTEAGIKTAIESVTALSSQLAIPLAVETGVNYLKPNDKEIPDGEFVARVIEGANCGLLLDLHNIWTNEVNGRQPVHEFLAQIPLDRVWEIHLGGGFAFQGYWLDSHSGAVPQEVLEIAAEYIPKCPNLKAIIFELFPAFLPYFGLEAISDEISKIRNLWNTAKESIANAGHNDFTVPVPVVTRLENTDTISPEFWEHTLGELVTEGKPRNSLADSLKNDFGVELTRKLIWRFRAGSIVNVLHTTTRIILLHDSDKKLEKLLDTYFAKTKPKGYASEEALGFIAFLRHTEPDIPYLEDVLIYEELKIKSELNQKTYYHVFSFDPRVLFQALIDGYLPDAMENGMYELEISPESTPIR